MSVAEQIRSNAAVHGVKWAVRNAIRKGVNLDIVRFVLVGSYRKSRRV